MSNYNKISDLCFSDCVWDFTSRSVSRGEDNCAENCVEKYIKMNQRISTRFQVKRIESFLLPTLLTQEDSFRRSVERIQLPLHSGSFGITGEFGSRRTVRLETA